ncbi:MAG: GNAT family N-acetyltransferase [Thermoleophilia bacterium]|nr:GNAT family N-acetyltransferase [Thermoleophilia bacterium]
MEADCPHRQSGTCVGTKRAGYPCNVSEPDLLPSVTAARAGVIIRATRLDDLDAIHETLMDPGVIPTTLQVPFTSIEARRDWLAASLRNRLDRSLVAEAIDGGEVVGNLGLMVAAAPRRRHVADLGMSVRDAWQGRGVGTALLAAACDVADNWLQLRRIELEVYPDNLAGLALYRRFGFVEEGRRIGDSFRNGTYADTLVMGRLRPDLR